jgi:hypothetical protein
MLKIGVLESLRQNTKLFWLTCNGLFALMSLRGIVKHVNEPMEPETLNSGGRRRRRRAKI